MVVGEISARDIAVSGLRAERTRMNVIANNIANAETTRTADGGPFRRQLAVFRGEELERSASGKKGGVRVTNVIADKSPFRQVYDPSHPDANAEGYVSYPNISLAVEMIDLTSAQRAYDANVAVIVSDRSMTQKALQLIEQ